jgi:phenylpyruvate tautomerase PptA (4-oxalocrotonate tautomerase family)
MPIITCDIRVGRTKEQKSRLAMGLTKAVQEATGVSIDYIFLVIRCQVSISSMQASMCPNMSPVRMDRTFPGLNSFVAAKPQKKQRLRRSCQPGRFDMPLIQCDLEAGLSDSEKRDLVKRITEITHQAIGSAYGHINVVLREHPLSNLGEAGEVGRGLISVRARC